VQARSLKSFYRDFASVADEGHRKAAMAAMEAAAGWRHP